MYYTEIKGVQNAYLCNWIFHHKDICHCSELSEILPQFLGGRLPRETSDEELSRRAVGGGCASAGGPVLTSGLCSTGAVAVHSVHVDSGKDEEEEDKIRTYFSK